MDRFVKVSRPRFVMGVHSFGRMLMLEADYLNIYHHGRFESPQGGFDPELAAKAGVRIFVFVTEDYLRDIPEAREYVCGTWNDIDAIIGGGKVHVLNDVGQGMLNPLQNILTERLNLEDSPWLAVAKVTVGEFRKAFGPKRFTSIFTKEL
jgi:hypothetical protein